MTRKSDEATVTPRRALTAADVIDYLRRHPDFLARNAAALDDQRVPARAVNGDRVLDLQQFMVEKLRRDIQQLRTDQDELVANSRDNLSTQSRVHRSVLALLEARSLEELIEMISTDLAVLLDVDVVALCLEPDEPEDRKSQVEGVQILEPGTIESILGAERDLLLRDDVRGDQRIFAGAAGLIRSDALLRLDFDPRAPKGLIAFGTRHPGFFHVGQGTELLHFLARIVEHSVRSWVDWPN